MNAPRRPLPPLLLALALLGALAPACRRSAEAEAEANTVARVNGQVLGRAEFERELARELAGTESPPRTPEEIEPLKRALLDTLVNRMLLLQAARERNVGASAAEVDRALLRLSSDFPGGKLEDALAQGGLSLAELREKETARLTVEKLYAAHVYPRVAVTEEELRSYYAAHSQDFQQPERVRAAQIVVKDLADAKRVQAELRAGKPFDDLARKYSLSADAKVGGDLGFFPRGQMPPQFDEVAFKLRPGQVSDVVTTEYGYHLFKLLDRQPARSREFGEVRAEVERRLLADKRAQAQDAFLRELKARGQVRVNETTLQAIRPPPAPAAAAATDRR